jgi:hypothetical protein
MNRLVHILFHLRPKLATKAGKELYSIGGRTALWNWGGGKEWGVMLRPSCLTSSGMEVLSAIAWNRASWGMRAVSGTDHTGIKAERGFYGSDMRPSKFAGHSISLISTRSWVPLLASSHVKP